MKKYFLFSIDDGTIYDKKVIEIFARYNIKATFNLNSGLDDFVWYLDDKPIERLHLSENIHLYDGHEVASHSLTHPHLTMCPDDYIYYEVNQDCSNLEDIFHREVNTFAFPFEDFDERCIDIIKNINHIKCIRLSEVDESFQLPVDPYHIKITAIGVEDTLKLLPEFKKDKNAKIFIFVAHAYDFEVNDTYQQLEEICNYVKENDFEIITFLQIPSLIN